MKKIFINALKISLVAYTISLSTSFNITFIILLTIIFSIILPFHSPIFLITSLLNKNYYLFKILLAIILINILLQFIIKKSNRNLILSILTETLISLFLIYFFKDRNYIYLLVSCFISVAIMGIFIFLSTLSYDKNPTIHIKNNRLFEIFILSISYSNIIISKSPYSLELTIIILSYLRFLMNKYSFSFISLLNFFLYFLYLNPAKSPVLFFFTTAFFEPNLIIISMYSLYIIVVYKLSFLRYLLLITPLFALYLSYVINAPKKSKTKEIKAIDAFNNYLEITENFLNKTGNNNLDIEAKISNLYEGYCLNCSSHKSCFKKNKIATYNYLFLCTTYKGDLKTISLPESLKKFILACPYYKEMILTEKTTITSTNNSPIIKHIKSLTNELKTELENNKENALYYNLESYLISLGYRIKDYSFSIKDNLPEISFKVLNASISKINHVLVKQASFFLKHTYACQIQDGIVYLYMQPKIKLTFEHHSLAKENANLSGDNFYIKRDHNYKYLFALSDGMGSGYNAFCQSKEILNLVSNMSRLPLDIDTNISLINNVYQMKDNQENYATLDLLQIDCVNKECILYKLGGTNTYLVSGKNLKVLYNNNPPIGVTNISDSFRFKVNKGDVIVMLSDGVTEHVPANELNNLLLSLYLKNTTRIVNDILEFVTQRHKNVIKDDLSALAIKVL